MTWIFWLTATLVLSITPFLVYAAGGSDGATDSEGAGLGTIGLALAWPFLIVAAYFGSSGEFVEQLRGAVRVENLRVVRSGQLSIRPSTSARLRGDRGVRIRSSADRGHTRDISGREPQCLRKMWLSDTRKPVGTRVLR